jgi:hypothetical protein
MFFKSYMGGIMRLCLLAMLLSVLLLVPTASYADFLTVGCAGGDPNATHKSISEALNALPPGPNWIEVTGTCTENFWIWQTQSLTLAAPYAQTATITSAADPTVSWAPVVSVFGSHGLYLYGLVFQGGSNGLHVEGSSQVEVENCAFQNNLGDGVDLTDASMVRFISGSTINNGGGIHVTNSAVANINTFNGGTFDVYNNAGDGIYASGGSVVTYGRTTITNNGGFGIHAVGGARVQMGGPNSPNIIRGNLNGGASFEEHSEVSFWSGNIIQDSAPRLWRFR